MCKFYQMVGVCEKYPADDDSFEGGIPEEIFTGEKPCKYFKKDEE